jgi:hypothetical protein
LREGSAALGELPTFAEDFLGQRQHDPIRYSRYRDSLTGVGKRDSQRHDGQLVSAARELYEQ